MSETRKIAAILVSDVVGYSRLAGADEERILARLRALRSDLIDPTISVHRGRIVKRTGDGSVIEFRSVVDAVRCAIEVQHAMVERNAGVALEKRIEFRIGIHLGDVVEESDGDLMGDGVNIAARLEGICKPGAVCLSEDAYRQVKGRLDLAVSDLGPTQLKNIAEPVRVYSLEIGVPAQAKPSEPKRRLSPALAAALAALLIVIAGGAWWFLIANRPASVAANAPAEVARLSIVVLPFANLSGDPAQDYLVDALTDELTTSLARLRGAFVIARNTAMTFKGKPVDAKAIGKDLGVRYVLEGSVEPSGGQVRVNAQLIDASSGAHVWAQQFDTPRADLLQTQEAIVAHLAHAIDLPLIEAEAARVKQKPAANRDAEDLALQCDAGRWKAGFIGKEADAAYALCEQALAIDPNNVRALQVLGWKFFLLAQTGVSKDSKGDLERADELASKALALDPNWPESHDLKGDILGFQARSGWESEAVAEHERALALDPSNADAARDLGWDYARFGEFDKSQEYFDKAIRESPHDPSRAHVYGGKASANFGLKRYDQAIEWARQAIAISPNYTQYIHATLVAALALAGDVADAREALLRYLALPSTGPLKTIAAFKAHFSAQDGGPASVEANERVYEGLRKAGMPEEEPAEAPRLSIVVTPFANLSGDPGQDYLVDALTDELTTSLARHRGMFVIARNTAMTLKGKTVDAKAIGKDLGVRYVLEGSVQPSGDRMRVNAQLIDAESGAHLWAEQFDTPRADLLQTQDAIVAHLARALDFQLEEAEAARLKRTPTANRDAEDLALQCSAGEWTAGVIGKEADAALALCQQALAIDPNNVRALLGLAEKFWVQEALGLSTDPKGDLERADELASKALALDPYYAWAHVSKGWILQNQRRPEESIPEFERALALDPSFADAYSGMGVDYLALGRIRPKP